MSAENNKPANRRFYEQVINQQNVDAVEDFLAPEYVSQSVPPGLPPGPQGFKIFINAFYQGFPDGKVTIENMIAEGDMVATRLTFSGTHKGEFQGIPPTGKLVSVPAMDMARFAGGKIVEHWGGPDQLSLLQQLGAIPRPG